MIIAADPDLMRAICERPHDDAISLAAINWARSVAGLPPLED